MANQQDNIRALVRRWTPSKIAAIFAGVPTVVLLAATAAHAQFSAATVNPLPYSKGFLVTGNYVVGGVDLTPQANPPDANGFATGTLSISGVPTDADIVGAYLYWEQIFTPVTGVNPAAGIKFNGTVLSPTALKVSAFQLPSNPATCWGAAGSPSAYVADYRADVLYLLPKRLDASNKWTGKYVVNQQFTVTLPQRNGNNAVQSAGATLVIVYRDPSQPLRKVLIFDGAYPQPDGATMSEALRGFYRSDPTQSAQLTHIVGTGGNNQTETVSFDGVVVSTTDPFPQTSPSSDRSWASPTYSISPALMANNVNNSDGFGETATTSIQASTNPLACRASAAVIFSATVADVDHDGLPDGLEDGVASLGPPTASHPGGDALPNLNAMGASSSHRDIFIEINAMKAPANTSYGSATAPYNSLTATVTDPVGHNHMPTPVVLNMIAGAYLAQGIVPHFDVGTIATYHQLGSQYACTDQACSGDAYLVPSAYARGGESILEQKCGGSDPNKTVKCEFDAFPGTVGWKFGLQLYRNAPVADDGTELSVGQIKAATPAAPWGASRRRRFDRIRADYFHYVLYAHARGKPKSNSPCLDSVGNPTTYASDGTCNGSLTNNPAFHVPISVSGVADLPGNSVLITLGLWDNFVGTPFVQASTTLHELGHNLSLWHSGLPPVWGDKSLGTTTFVEPNCKPNYLSSMNYMFQVHGLFDSNGNIHLDYSGGAQDALNENGLFDIPLGPSPPAYVPAWFAPAGSTLAVSLGVSPATRFCNGVRFGPTPPTSLARVFAPSSTAAVDWNGDGLLNSAGPQNANFDGDANAADIFSNRLSGYNDWTHIRLDQIAAGRNATKFSDGDFLDLGSGDFLDFGSGDFLDFGSGDFLDLGSGDFLDFGSGDFLDFGSGDFLDLGSGDFLDLGSGDFLDFGSGDFLDFGSGDFLDFGSGDFLDFGSGQSQELDYSIARGIGRAAPFGLTGCVVSTAGCTQVPKTDPSYLHVLLTWNAPPFGTVGNYQIWRKKADAKTYTQIGTSTTTSFVDPNSVAGGVQYTYYVRAQINDELPNPLTGLSNLFTIVIPK